MTPAGIEPATFRFAAQHLNHCATAIPCFLLFHNVINNVPLIKKIPGRSRVMTRDRPRRVGAQGRLIIIIIITITTDVWVAR